MKKEREREAGRKESKNATHKPGIRKRLITCVWKVSEVFQCQCVLCGRWHPLLYWDCTATTTTSGAAAKSAATITFTTAAAATTVTASSMQLLGENLT